MVEIGHAPDCPGCAWAALSAADRHLLDPYGVQRSPHEPAPPPPGPDRPPIWRVRARWGYGRALIAWLTELKAWRGEQWTIWAARHEAGLEWPCPRCGGRECWVHYEQFLNVQETAQRNARLFSGMFDGA